MVGIYKITSPSGKVYIGQSIDIYRRWNSYKSASCESQRRLFHSFFKYGYDNHKFEIVHKLPSDIEQEILNRYEQLYMDLYRYCEIELLNLQDVGKYYYKTITNKIVYQYSLQGEFIKEWKSQTEAANALNIHNTSISDAIRGTKKTAGNFIWSCVYEPFLTEFEFTNYKGKKFTIKIN